MSLVKARIQGNATVVTIPKSFNVKPGTEFRFKKGKNGTLILSPSKKVPDTMEELFKNWHGKYQTPDDLKDWDNAKPVGQKRRPAVVVSNDILMKTSPFVWVVPISHGSFNGESYPLHVHLDSRTQSDGTIYVEQLKSFDFSRRKWKYIEQLPPDLLDEVRQKIKLVVS